ncbi:MAG: 4-hydroxyphenylpyruvate dioxygenase [Gammaproteobacteria bacterium]|nr:4-hydroxyphenylpyruvate dioxygenase [Gammaproteobacteria bacterium]NNF61604.1 4-hydroxyphenylpyruvate dioxygenase [Gammaproteobacteria bacterium]
MPEIRENPTGIHGFEFVEFAAPDPAQLIDLFSRLGFTRVARHHQRPITLWRQNAVNFLINEDPDSFAAEFAAVHGPCACGFAVRFADPVKAQGIALERGGREFTTRPETLALQAPVIEGIGGAALYFVPDDDAQIYSGEFVEFPQVDQQPRGLGLSFIDHLTHNVYQGNMDKWADFYENLFNFEEIRYFDIKGVKTGLQSRAMTAPDGKVRIPINESADDKSQIAEYLEEYKGEGIQHIALFTNNIYETVERLRENGIEFLDVPDTYYEIVPERIPEHGEDLQRMHRNYILIDADQKDKKQMLLQIFTQTCIGPIFFEIIQRKGNEGFGEGNFQALFDSIERDQQKRGVL